MRVQWVHCRGNVLGSPPGRCPDGGHGGVGMAWARQQPEQHLAIRPPRLRGPCLSVAPDRARACWPPRYPQGCVVSGAHTDHVLSAHTALEAPAATAESPGVSGSLSGALCGPRPVARPQAEARTRPPGACRPAAVPGMLLAPVPRLPLSRAAARVQKQESPGRGA